MKTRLVTICVVSILVSGCASSQSLSPAQLIGDNQADIAVQEFLIRSHALAYSYGLDFSYKADLATKLPISGHVNRDLFGFPIRTEVPYNASLIVSADNPGVPYAEITNDMRFEARASYIKAGAYASAILCRNYLSGLRDRNEYFEFLQKELGLAGGLADIAMQLSHANGTIRTSVTEGLLAINQGVTAYESFRFLSPDIETVLPIVETAQIALRNYYLSNPPTTFSGAMNAVSRIEYQCTRSGVRGLLNKTLIQSSPQFTVKDGILTATQAAPVQETSKKNK